MRSPRTLNFVLPFFVLLLIAVAARPYGAVARPLSTLISGPDGNLFLIYDGTKHATDSATLAALGVDEHTARSLAQPALERIPAGARLPALGNGSLIAGPDGAVYLLLDGSHLIPDDDTLAAYGWTGQGAFGATPVTAVDAGLLATLTPRAPVAPALRGADYQRFDWGYCTWWVAQRRSVPWLGDAKEWYGNAQRMGFAVGMTPVPGAILVRGPSAYSSYGHVAYVESVSGATFTVSEMNVSRLGELTTRTYDMTSAPPPGVLGFVYWRYGPEPAPVATDPPVREAEPIERVGRVR